MIPVSSAGDTFHEDTIHKQAETANLGKACQTCNDSAAAVFDDVARAAVGCSGWLRLII